MTSTSLTTSTLKAAHGQPKVLLVGQTDHVDFCEGLALLRADAELTIIPDITLAITELTGLQPRPELIVIMQSRPDAIGALQVKRLQRAAPLAGVVALLGSWCEGHGRTGRPWPGTQRVYGHEFAPWWQRQLTLRAAGSCPDWARMGDFGLPAAAGKLLADCGLRNHPIQNAETLSRGLVLLAVPRWETADALGDLLAKAGYASVWQSSGIAATTVRGAVAGIWEGGQLDEHESGELAAFCRQLAKELAPVITLLDFPRHDSVKLASELGAAAVLGKPCLNEMLVTTIEQCRKRVTMSEQIPRAA